MRRVIFNEIAATEGYQLKVDLGSQTITRPNADGIKFEVDDFRKHCLINGLDDIDMTLEHVDDIKAYEQHRAQQAPWLFN